MTSKYRLTVNLGKSEFDELIKLAEANNVSKAWLCRRAILSFLEENTEDFTQLPLTGVVSKEVVPK